jgi:hypothetical protein
MAGELDDRWLRAIGAGGKSGHHSASAENLFGPLFGPQGNGQRAW